VNRSARRSELRQKDRHEIAAQAKAIPQFSDLAKRRSQDRIGAQGGDLGVTARGTMVNAFDDAVFAMSPARSPAR
jgi:parvulin-like peptidyl-prolyl isomerase